MQPVRDIDIANAIDFLRRTAVGRLDEDRLVATVEALEKELVRRYERSRKRTTG